MTDQPPFHSEEVKDYEEELSYQRLGDVHSLSELRERVRTSFAQLRGIYRLIGITFGIDLLLAFSKFSPGIGDPENYLFLSQILLLVALIGLLREKLISHFFDFDRFKQGIQSRFSQYSILLTAVIALLVSTDLILRIGAADLLIVVIALLSMLSSLPSFFKSVRNARKEREKISRDETLLFQRNLKLVRTVILTPAALARIAAFFATLAGLGSFEAQLVWLCALLVFLAMAPGERFMLRHCGSCGVSRPRIGRLAYCRFCPTEHQNRVIEKTEPKLGSSPIEPEFLSDEYFEALSEKALTWLDPIRSKIPGATKAARGEDSEGSR